MQKPRFSIGMPSNRKWDTSREAIESAVNFCKKTGYHLAVSDNSGDPAKEAACKALMQAENLHYIKSPPCGMMENWFAAFNAADAEFTLMMGDDDTIFSFGETPDLSVLPPDCAGVKPCLFAYTNKGGLMKMNPGVILGNSGPDRIVEYAQSAQGCNIGIFTFWRRDILKSIMELWFLHHPTKGYYCDWAIMNALVSSGKVFLDISSCYFYNLQNWDGDQAHIMQQVEKAFIGSGLPPGSSVYHALFNAVDSFIFVNRKDSPMAAQERGLTAIFSFDSYLKNYLAAIPQNSQHPNAKEILKLSLQLVGNDSVPSIFAVLSDIFGAIRPGMDKEYREFHQFATGKPWGEF